MAVQTNYTHGELMQLWALAGGAPGTEDTAAAVALAESGGCLYAKAGPTDDRPIKTCTYRKTTLEDSYGLWQINRDAHPQYGAASLYTALGNAQAAEQISGGGSSFNAWTTFQTGAYLQYLSGLGAIGTTGTGGGAVSAIDDATRTLAGYHSFQLALSRRLPHALHDSGVLTQTTLRLLARRHKVH